MGKAVEEELKRLAELFDEDAPLYLVGGRVRDCIVRNFSVEQTDADICSAADFDDFLERVERAGMSVESASEKLGTAWIKGKEGRYEYATFRKDSYPVSKGDHLPEKVEFVRDIAQDSLRRDFKCNAVYYDIVGDKIVDPLGGIDDIDKRILCTTRSADKVFCEDGLRILRLFRFCATLGFDIEKDTLSGAKKHCRNLDDIKSERIAVEIKRLLEGERAQEAMAGAIELGAMGYVLKRVDERLSGFDDINAANGISETPVKLRIVTILINLALSKSFEGYTEQYIGELTERWKKVYPQSVEKGLKIIELATGIVKARAAKIDIKKISIDYAEQIDDIAAVLGAMSRSGDKASTIAAGKLERWMAVVKDKKIPLKISDLKLTGDDIKNLGYKGADIRKTLENLRDWCVENQTESNREELTEIAVRWRKNNG
ncbi:MAG: hypothetical protein ACI4MI_02765 [Christensenellales bacterium]